MGEVPARLSRMLPPRTTRIALLLASFTLILGLAEIAARLTSPDSPPAPLPPQPADSDLPELKKLNQLARPNALGIHRDVLYRTNSRGIRGPETNAAAAPGILRIGIVGDSVTVGWGVAEEDAYPRQLERILNAEFANRRFEVLNFGLAGINADVAIRRLSKLDEFYRPDLLIYGFTPNDIEGPNYLNLSSPKLRARFGKENLKPVDSPSRLYARLVPMLKSIREFYWPAPGSPSAERLHNYLENPAAWKDFEAALDRLKAMGERSDRCVHVLIHTQIMYLGLLHPLSPIYEKVGEAARSRGFGVTQTLEEYRFQNERRLWVRAKDPHPNREGHAILARALADDLLALPDHCFEADRKFKGPSYTLGGTWAGTWGLK